MTPKALSEFERVQRFFAPLAAPGALGLVDDVALIDGPPGEPTASTSLPWLHQAVKIGDNLSKSHSI